ncbi:CamS family sex pheromone protein [Radiobacillus deserti]|uniref:CamS family sex pheromone protein n=1 Tax=Radiobacillus deserti TaxID=2594883 RepID=A0A516KD04_9BACI|nr:CamS family sex pheromone protein [Radiobacillus deserti]
MRKKLILMLIGLLLLTSCAPSFDNSEEDVVKKNQGETNQETAIIPSYSLSDENYRVLLPYKLGKARGVIVNQLFNRLDIDELEEGLKRHSKDAFDPDKYYFQEGQYLTEDIVYDWLSSSNPKEEGNQGLNPPLSENATKEEHQENPRYLSHILEQNYLLKTSEDRIVLGGVSVALAMKSVYQFQTEIGGPYYYEKISKKEMLSKGQEIAQKIVERMRQMDGLSKVPIMVSLYREEAADSLVPGNFVAKTVVSEGSSSIGDWEEINEKHVLFPSDEASENYKEDANNLTIFEEDVAKYFPNYTSVIGKGFYVNDELQRLTIEIPIQFNGKAEVIGFTQYVYGLVVEGFQPHYDLEINITSGDNRQESLITREAGEEEPQVHIYH